MRYPNQGTRHLRICLAAIFLIAGWLLAPARFTPVVNAQTTPLPRPTMSRQKMFSIPFQVARSRNPAEQPVEVQLYVSVDHGASWNLHGRLPPGPNQFVVQAPADGEYWFNVRSIDASGQARPATTNGVELIVVVDTAAPQIAASADRRGSGEIVIHWQVDDRFIDTKSLQISYQLGSETVWESLAIDPTKTELTPTGLRGETLLWPGETSAPIAIKLGVSDQAGNSNTTQVHVASPARLAPLQSNNSAPTPQNGPAFGSANQNSGPNQLANNRPPQPTTSPWPVQRRGDSVSLLDQMNRYRFVPAGEATVSPWRAEEIPAPTPSGPELVAAPPGMGTQLSGPQLAGPWRTQTVAQRLTSDSQLDDGPSLGTPSDYEQVPEDVSGAVEIIPAGEAIGAVELSNEVAADDGMSDNDSYGGSYGADDIQRINSAHFSLDYVVDSPQSSQEVDIQLWLTRDGGQSWRLFAHDEDGQSPFEVAAPGEGIYGFKIVAATRQGLSGRPPREGDAPEVSLAIDLTPPQGRILSVELSDDNKTGQLVIRWESADTNLAAKPVSLSIGENRQGPWRPISPQLPNSGRFAWAIGEEAPEELYLRLEIKDTAGNVAHDVTTDPVSLATLRPSARIQQIRPLAPATQAKAKTYQFFY